jgi:hypothetical protein
VRWELRFRRKAVQSLYTIDRALVANVWAALRALSEDPDDADLQPDEDDPSLFWLADEGDVTIWLEIHDEGHSILIVKIE